MKILSVIFLLFIFLNLSAQTKDEIPVSNTSIGLILSPVLSNAVQQNGQSAKFAYTAGFNISYKLNEIFSIMSGLLFSDRGYKENLYIPVNNPNLPSNIKLTYNNHFIEIPINAEYSICKIQHLNLFISGGISLNYLFYSTTISDNYYDNGNTTHIRQVDTLSGIGFNERFEIGGNIGFGLKYNLKNNLFLCFEPDYRFYIAPFSNSVSTSMLNTVGINLGIFYRFGSRFKPLPD